MDWKDQTRQGYMRAYMVSPNNLDLTLGELTGVDWARAKISAAYYSTARTSASLVLVNGNWVRNTFIRLVYEIPEWDYIREIGTYLVTNDNAVRKNGAWQTTLELHSMLYGMSVDLSPNNLTIVGNASFDDVVSAEFEQAGREYSIIDATSYNFVNPVVFESGKSRLTRVSSMCNTAGNRLDVNGHGVITVEEYVAPAQKCASLELSLTDSRGIVKNGVSRSTNWLELPNQAVVSYKYTTTDENGDTREEEIVAVVSAADDTALSFPQRGYNVTHFQSLTDMTPATYARAEEIAKRNLAANSQEKVEYSLNCKYIPVWEGDVIELDIPDGLTQYLGRRKCLVKNIDLTGPFWDMTLTLKETDSGEESET